MEAGEERQRQWPTLPPDKLVTPSGIL